MPEQFQAVRSAAIDGRAHNPIYRKTQLKKLYESLAQHGPEVEQALSHDSGYREVEVRTEYQLALRCLKDAFEAIDPAKVLEDEYATARGKDAPFERAPVGIVVIEPAPHAFFFCLLCALAPALAAGNCVIVRIQHNILQGPRTILEFIGRALDRDILQITYEEVKAADLGHPHVLISQNSGSAAPTLVNHFVSPSESRVVAVVERDADIDAAAKSLVVARFSLRGKSPHAPDVVLVNEWVKRNFLAAATRHYIQLIPSSGDKQRNRGGFECPGFLDEITEQDCAHVLASASDGAIVEVQARNSPLIRRKTQEPCLVIHSVTSMDDAIDYSLSLGPLAVAYVFTKPAMAKYLGQHLSARVTYMNHIPASLLFQPVAPIETPPRQDSSTPYPESCFTVPKPKYSSCRKFDADLMFILYKPSQEDIRNLGQSMVVELPPISRRKRGLGADVGFFSQGVLTGGLMMLSVVFTCTLAVCYYSLQAAHLRM